MNDVCYEKETTTKNIAEDVIEDTTENIFELLDDEILNELEKVLVIYLDYMILPKHKLKVLNQIYYIVRIYLFSQEIY